MKQHNYTPNVLPGQRDKGTKPSLLFQKSKVINSIVAYLRSNGLQADGSARTSKSFCDIMANISGKPLEAKVIAKRLSQAQSQYKRSIENAGGIYVAVTDAEESREWYRATFKS